MTETRKCIIIHTHKPYGCFNLLAVTCSDDIKTGLLTINHLSHWLSCFSSPNAKVSLVSAGAGDSSAPGVQGSALRTVERALWGIAADSADWGTPGEAVTGLWAVTDKERSRIETQMLIQL